MPSFEKPPQKESAINRIVTKNKEDEEQICATLEEKFKNQEWYDFERDKTPKEVATFEQINTHMQDFVERFGATYKPVTMDNVHIMDAQKIPHEMWSSLKTDDGILINGEFFSEVQSMFIVGPSIKNEDLLGYAHIYVHELLHLQSFNSFEVNEIDQDGAKLKPRRSGFTVYSHKEEEHIRCFFSDMNEAMTQELTRRFVEEFFPDIAELEDDIASHKELFPHLAAVDQMTETWFMTQRKKRHGMSKTQWGKGNVYAPERQKLHKTIAEIYQKNSDQFANENDVFQVFAQSYFSGNVLPIARLIRKTYGKDALRTHAQHTQKELLKKNCPPHELELNEK